MGQIKAPFVAGTFKDVDAFVHAAEAAGPYGRQYRDLDAVCPYPVHGLDPRLGIKRSWIGRLVLFVLLTGAFGGFMMQQWMMEVDWPIIIAGKPYNSWPAYVVITFESGILLGALTNMAACLFIACKLLPKKATVVLRKELTDDTFALAIPVEGNASEAELRSFLAEQHAENITLYRHADKAEPEAEVEEAAHA